MKILVTGGCGFIGSYLIKELLKKNNEIIVFDNGFRAGFQNTENHKDDLVLIKGDVTDEKDWEKIPKDVEKVFHLAAINGTKFFYEIPEKVLKVNVGGTLNFFKWLENTDVKKIFFASSSEVYGFPKKFPTPETEPLVIPDPSNPRFSYSSSKIIGEILTINITKLLGIKYTIGRFHNVYGPKMGFEHVMPEFIRRLVKNEPFLVQGDGMESRCFCYISDAIEAVLLIMDSNEGDNNIFNIGNTQETKIRDLIEILINIHGTIVEPKYTEFKNPGTNRRVPDLEKISKLGYNAKIDLEAGLRLTYDWYNKHYTKN